jgi:hypothetical protein
VWKYNTWQPWLKQSGSFGKKIIMNKCNGTERKKRWFVCSDPFFSISFHFIRFHSIFYLEKRNATERNGGRERRPGRASKKLFLYYLEKRSGMERNGTETGREGRSRIRQPNIAKYIPWTFLPSLFRSVPCDADVELGNRTLENTFPGPFFHLCSAPLRVTLM